MTRSVTLSGMSWNHTLGLTSMVATAQRFMDEHSRVTIRMDQLHA